MCVSLVGLNIYYQLTAWRGVCVSEGGVDAWLVWCGVVLACQPVYYTFTPLSVRALWHRFVCVGRTRARAFASRVQVRRERGCGWVTLLAYVLHTGTQARAFACAACRQSRASPLCAMRRSHSHKHTHGVKMCTSISARSAQSTNVRTRAKGVLLTGASNACVLRVNAPRQTPNADRTGVARARA